MDCRVPGTAGRAEEHEEGGVEHNFAEGCFAGMQHARLPPLAASTRPIRAVKAAQGCRAACSVSCRLQCCYTIMLPMIVCPDEDDDEAWELHAAALQDLPGWCSGTAACELVFDDSDAEPELSLATHLVGSQVTDKTPSARQIPQTVDAHISPSRHQIHATSQHPTPAHSNLQLGAAEPGRAHAQTSKPAHASAACPLPPATSHTQWSIAPQGHSPDIDRAPAAVEGASGSPQHMYSCQLIFCDDDDDLTLSQAPQNHARQADQPPLHSMAGAAHQTVSASAVSADAMPKVQSAVGTSASSADMHDSIASPECASNAHTVELVFDCGSPRDEWDEQSAHEQTPLVPNGTSMALEQQNCILPTRRLDADMLPQLSGVHAGESLEVARPAHSAFLELDM